MEIFARQKAWRQQELQQHLNIPRSTLQRDLSELVQQGRLVAQGATRNRIYLRTEDAPTIFPIGPVGQVAPTAPVSDGTEPTGDA
jgi:hypothetical protein